MNRIDLKTGEPSRCNVCGSVYHWERQCDRQRTDSNERNSGILKDKSKIAMEARTVDFNLLAQSFNNNL